MIEFNPNKKIEKNTFTAKVPDNKALRSVQDLLAEVIDEVNSKVYDVGTFPEIVKLIDNPNQYQGIDKIGFRIRPDSDSINSKKRILQLVATKKSKTEKAPRYQYYAVGTKEEILRKLKDKKILEDLKKHIDDSSMDFITERKHLPTNPK